MSGFNFALGRSNNMVVAEDRGMMTIGRWGKRHGVSARAAVEVMHPAEAHHTGTGRRGKSRLTPVIASDCEPSAEQLAAMRAWDAGERPAVRGWYIKWLRDYSGFRGRRRNVPTLGVYVGDPADAPRDLAELDEADFARATALAGHTLVAFARRFDDLRAD